MAWDIKGTDLGVVAAEDLSADQYSFVVQDSSSGLVRRPDSGTERALGVLQNAPLAGEAAVVRIAGVTKVVANAALAVGALVTLEYVSATDAGKAAATTTARAKVRGVVVEASGAEDDLAVIRLAEFTYPETA